MYDGVTLASIPARGSQMIGYYLNGEYAVATVTGVEKLFPRKVLVPIDVTGARANYARVLDVESGDASPATAAEWVQSFKLVNPSYPHGGRPVIYCNRSTLGAVLAAMHAAGQLAGREFYLWIATQDGTQYHGPGVIACQTWDRGGYDESVVYSDQWMPGGVA
jgi:hypothetical protein